MKSGADRRGEQNETEDMNQVPQSGAHLVKTRCHKPQHGFNSSAPGLQHGQVRECQQPLMEPVGIGTASINPAWQGEFLNGRN
jgi:hypothetical protein